MPQMNIHLTDDFAGDLVRLMRRRGLPSRSETIRVAVREAIERTEDDVRRTDFESWIGVATTGRNPNPRFRNNDDLWG